MRVMNVDICNDSKLELWNKYSDSIENIYSLKIWYYNIDNNTSIFYNIQASDNYNTVLETFKTCSLLLSVFTMAGILIVYFHIYVEKIFFFYFLFMKNSCNAIVSKNFNMWTLQCSFLKLKTGTSKIGF